MGKNLISQRRGRGTSTFRATGFRNVGDITHPKNLAYGSVGKIKDIIHCPGHSAPLIVIDYQNKESIILAPEGVRVGDNVRFGAGTEIKPGNTSYLSDIPEGVEIYNLEAIPGDGGKFARGSGNFARILAKTENVITVRLPSKKQKEFSPKCLATIGIIAGAGRIEKPFLKAGNKYHRMKARNKFWPSVSAISMNAVDHPFGSKGSHTKGKPTQSSRNAPPGRKVGKIAPKRTGRRNR